MVYDVVVVGAGPAGSAVARLTAEAGLNVLILEEHGEVGLPLQCSGFVTERTLREIGEGADALVRNRVKGAVVHGPGGAQLELGGDKVRAIAVDRTALDQHMANVAHRAGAELLLRSRVRGISRDGECILLQVSQGGLERTVTVGTRLLIGADGWNSTVARWMGVSRGTTISAVSVDTVIPDHPVDMARIYVGNDIAPGWFGWSIPAGDGGVRLGIGCDPAQRTAKPRRLLENLIASFPDELSGARLESFSGGFIPLYQSDGRAASTVTDNVMLVGDAASQVKPTSGGGIYAGLLSARHAAHTAVAALESGDLSADALAPYDESWKGDLEDEFNRGADVRGLFLGLSDGQLERLIRLLRMPGVRHIIENYGDIDYQSPLYAQLMRAVPMLRVMLSIPAHLPNSWGKLAGNGSALRQRIGEVASVLTR